MNTDKSSNIDDVVMMETIEGASPFSSVRGRKSNEDAEEAPGVVSSDSESSDISDEDSLSDDEDYDIYEEDDEEDDEEWLERLRILEDARKLKKVAAFFLHPEKAVETESTASARCFFERPSAPEGTSADEEAERVQVIKDSEALKKLAVDYAHPERALDEIDSTAFGRCYFDRASALAQESEEAADEAAQILEDAKLLKQAAYQYLHPEKPTSCTDANACGRNYFSRPSAPEQESIEEAAERASILADAQLLKKSAVNYFHPEAPVATDPAVMGRNYFVRPSAPGQESIEVAAERARVLADAQLLKKSAFDYLHPEAPVATDPATMGRNYFARPSAPEQESIGEAAEHARILADAQLLKKSAVEFLHPEAPVATDPTAMGRNYFGRASAPEQETTEETTEHARILADAQLLKKSAVEFLHPEAPVATDPAAMGRNYFGRPSAPEQETTEEATEHARILADAQLLKKSAVEFLHPEAPVATDPAAMGRNYFGRPSAPEQETTEEATERARILADAQLLKKSAVDYLHPEATVTADPSAMGRNYFTRLSAPEQESMEKAAERARILAEAQLLKKNAVDYLHPEAPVTVDPSAMGRNYFARPSAPGISEHINSGVLDKEKATNKHKTLVLPQSKAQVEKSAVKDLGANEEGKMVRSPSDVMLFNSNMAEETY